MHGRSPAGFLDSEPLVKGFRIASAELPSLAAVFLSSSPGDTARTLGRESKGEAFVTRSVMNTPLQAQPVARPCGSTVAETVKHSGRRQPQTPGRGAPEPPRGERLYLPQTGLIEDVRGRKPRARDAQGGCKPSPQGMSAKARTWSSPTATKPLGRPCDTPVRGQSFCNGTTSSSTPTQHFCCLRAYNLVQSSRARLHSSFKFVRC